MNVADVLAPIPYLRVHQLAVEPCEGAIKLRMPVHKEVTNHVGIVHAGALFTVAETAAGVAALDVIPGGQAIVLLRGATPKETCLPSRGSRRTRPARLGQRLMQHRGRTRASR
ncbi:MAG: PaaI family thioesterase [Deltaproteobacteria bacterium]|nr:PaaI family thioesterase [Deltaproteobacteria bacterium]